MKTKILYIHGFNGSPNGQTATAVKNFFGEQNVIAESYNLFTFNSTIKRINETIEKENIKIVVGHSLGGFYTFAIKNPKVYKIVINPCMKPSEVLDQISQHYSGAAHTAYKLLFKHYLQKVEKNIDYSNKRIHKNYFGAFSTQDEFPSYKKFFDSNIKSNSTSISIVDAHHRLDDHNMKKVLTEGLRKFHLLR